MLCFFGSYFFNFNHRNITIKFQNYVYSRIFRFARNNLAFEDINAILPDSDHKGVNKRIMNLMEATYQWRIQQINQGKIEVRCEQTKGELEDVYGEILLNVLEMKTNDAPFDDYRTLINLIN